MLNLAVAAGLRVAELIESVWRELDALRDKVCR